MEAENENVVVATVDVDGAVATQTAIDEGELEEARLDQRWHDFCLNAEQYVAETTRRRPRVEQTA